MVYVRTFKTFDFVVKKYVKSLYYNLVSRFCWKLVIMEHLWLGLWLDDASGRLEQVIMSLDSNLCG